MNSLLFSFAQSIGSLWQAVKRRLRQWTKPINDTLVLGTALDITRSKSELVLENALLRQQLIVLKRQAKRPKFTWRDRALFVLLSSKLRTWKNALVIGELASRPVLGGLHHDYFWQATGCAGQGRGQPQAACH